MLGHYFHRIILIHSATPCEQCCARDYIHHGSATSGTKRGASVNPRVPFPVPLGTGTRLRHALAALTEMKAGCLHWYTIHNSSRDDRCLRRAKTFRASMRSAAAVCRELCVAKRRIIIL